MIDSYRLVRAEDVEIGSLIQYQSEDDDELLDEEEFFLVEDMESDDAGNMVFYDEEDTSITVPQDALVRVSN